MTNAEQRVAAKQFYLDWDGKGDEKQDAQRFWIGLLQRVYGVEEPDKFILFEQRVMLEHTGYIDAYIDSTKVLIEQKGVNIDLKKAQRQSDGSVLTPYQQARRYAGYLPHSQNPKWIVVSNFRTFEIHNMEKPNDEPFIIALSDLEKEYHLMQFLVEDTDKQLKHEMEVSIKAGEVVGQLYDAFHAQYADPDAEASLQSLNKLCVRLVFCLYAEDAEIFDRHGLFHDYLEQFNAQQMRKALVELFHVLDQKEGERDPYLKEDNPKLAAFPYVNGGLFADEHIEIPPFTEKIRDLLLEKASEDFDWSEISPTIFGAVFESTLNPETRRSGGMHYTSIENIHKVIDPLFMDDLQKELDDIRQLAESGSRTKKLKSFQKKLSELTFLDPACGSGNFLTETYLSIRKLENEVLMLLLGDQIIMGFEETTPIQVTIDQFYGIEINDFAVTVAKTALWIAESQMMKKTEAIVHKSLDFLPLKSNAYIVEGNALQMDWEEVVPKTKLNYIMGNPPFVGKKYQSFEQKADMKYVFGTKTKGIGNLDYVTAWYRKSIGYMVDTKITAAFVSTNSIVQGEHIPLLWKHLYENWNVNILFAYQTFQWDNETKDKAAVHCVIIGFCIGESSYKKQLYLGNGARKKVQTIHPYLIELPDIFIENRSKPIENVSPLVYGSFALDDGNYTIGETEYQELVQAEPELVDFIKPFIGSEEFIKGKQRYCIWLEDANITDIKKSKILSARVKNVQEWRSKSKRKETVAAADTPTLFAENRQPNSDYMAIPITSSERRRYIPMGYMSKDIIASNHLLVLPNAGKYEFGILMSNVHMAWMRTVAGRMKSDYNYSARIVYNNFPWPKVSEQQKNEVIRTAQAILDARKLYPDNTLAELYDAVFMPPELRRAHQQNDKAVMEAYGFKKKGEDGKMTWLSESETVAELMKMYQKLTSE